MKADITKSLDKNYIEKLFESKKLIYFPEFKDQKIKAIEIEKKSPDWQKETCLVRYKIFFDEGGHKVVWGAASDDNSKKNTWDIMNFLFDKGFNRNDFRIAKPLDFINETGLLFYQEAEGIPLTKIIQEKDYKKIEKSLENAAKWLSKLHKTKSETRLISDATFFESSNYADAFIKIKKIMPDLEKELISVSELGFIDKISESKKVLIHNDFYPGNIIIDDKITYGIDLAKSGFGFQFMDVATLFGWFELPAKSFSINFSEKDGRSFQKLFLETYCALSELNYTKTRQELNKFLAKVFLDQTDICATLATKAWNYIDSTAKNDPKKKINALLQKAKNYATGG